MVNVNKKQLSSKEQVLLLRRFDSTLAKLPKNSLSIFLTELLGKEERLMIAKRLAAIVLICEGYSEYRTAHVLKLSPTTTGIIASKIDSDAYKNIIRLLKKKKRNYIELIDAIDSILHLGGVLPHRYGLDRYRNLPGNYSG